MGNGDCPRVRVDEALGASEGFTDIIQVSPQSGVYLDLRGDAAAPVGHGRVILAIKNFANGG